MIVCLDTQIIQWGAIGRSSDPASDQLVVHAKAFINWVEKQKHDVIVPSIIIGELLVPVHQRDHANTLAKLREDWLVVDYDVRAALLFAQMRYDRALKMVMDDIKANNPYATRRQLVADVMIIATAIVHGAEKVYSHNNDFLRLAQGYIPAENFADIDLQYTLPETE